MIKISRVVKKSDGWYVVSHTTGRNLGGPYLSRERAEKRLAQVRAFKYMKKTAVSNKALLRYLNKAKPSITAEKADVVAKVLNKATDISNGKGFLRNRKETEFFKSIAENLTKTS